MTTPVLETDLPRLKPEQLASRAQQKPELVKQLIEGLDSNQARMKFGCAKALRLLAEEHPQVLYPFFQVFVRLLDHPNKIFQWQASIVLSHLAQVDTGNKFATVFNKYFRPIRGPVMISAANVIGSSRRIARANPQWADRIAAELLKVKRARYATAECRNVAIGHAVTAFGEFFDLLRKPEPVIGFLRSQLKNSRPATSKKAERLLTKIRTRRKGI